MNASPKKLVNIVIPPSVNEVSAGALQLCELFLGAIIGSSKNETRLEIDKNAKQIKSSDGEVRDVINLILGSGRFQEFYSQIVSILHKSETKEYLGEIRYVREDVMCRIAIAEEVAGDSQLRWNILRIRKDFNGSHLQLQSVAGGQSCPQDGWWMTPARSGSRRIFKRGDMFPDFEGNSYGATFWQLDLDQSKK